MPTTSYIYYIHTVALKIIAFAIFCQCPKMLLQQVIMMRQQSMTICSDRKSTRLNSSHLKLSRMPSSA